MKRLLIDNAGALVLGRDAESGKAQLHPDFAAFCRDQGVEVRVCQRYRARTRGKSESGVKYVKRNAVAGLAFVSFAALRGHLGRWSLEADERVHGTTHEAPRVRFERDEKKALRALGSPALPVRRRRPQRRVATDCLVDVDTVRYSVPHRLVRERVEVLVGLDEVRICHGGAEVARHRRTTEPHATVREPAHYAGLWRTTEAPTRTCATDAGLAATGRSLEDCARIVQAAAGGAS